MTDKKENELVEVEQSLSERILDENNPEELKELIDLFNLNLKKKNIIRSEMLSDVQDKIVDQMSKRIENRPDEFSNADLLNYHKVVQDTLQKTDNNIDDINVPQIQINQQFNVNNADTDSFDKESRKKILSIVQTILESTQE